MTLPLSQDKRDLIKAYLKEAVQHTKDKDLADSRLKSVFESIKEQEESLGYTLPEFKEALTAALNYEKVQALVDKKSEAIATVDILGL